jgi:hypothetical protein
MLTAQMTIVDLSGRSVIAVEILDKGPRPGTAWVRALGGITPFTRYTHGGPTQEDTALVLLPHLVHLEVIPELQGEDGQAQPVPIGTQLFEELTWTR